MSSTKLNWILVGAPNSGKTSLFNQLTGNSKEVMNYPGSTVTSYKAIFSLSDNQDVLLTDTPGVYSLDGDSLEEKELLHTISQSPKATLIFVVDARFFEQRSKLLAAVLKLHHPCIIYCTRAAQSNLNLEQLNAKYGIPLIADSSPLSLKALTYAATHLQHIPQENLKTQKPYKDISPKLDQIFLHPYGGFWMGLLMLAITINLIFYIAHPISTSFEMLMDHTITFLNQQGSLVGSLSSGVILGLGSLLMFTPQIFLLFALIFWTQESGYLARSAVVFDSALRYFGLSGKSIVPLLSGFSCAVPAVLLTKNIDSKRERLLAMIAIPFLVCSARIPMLTMCISFLFYTSSNSFLPGLIFTACYFISFLLGLIAAAYLGRLLPKETSSSFLMLELPPYQTPKLKRIIKLSAKRVISFIKEAGGLIFTTSFIIWAATSFPMSQNNQSPNIHDSYIAKIAKLTNPIFEPMGTDWRVGTALVASFAAREVFVPSITMLMNKDLSESTGDSVFSTFQQAKKSNGDKLFSTPSIIALLVFFMIALQCSSTTVIIAKESKSWKFALLQFMIMNILAYSLSVCTYQLLKGFI